MGLCASKTPAQDPRYKEDKTRSKALENQIVQDQKNDQQVNKLLLLGAGESGKSTLFKQMITIYGKGFSTEDRKEYIHVVFANIITSSKTLCDQSDKLVSKGISGTKVQRAHAAKKYIEDMKEEVIDQKCATHMRDLWADPGIQVTYEHRALYQLYDSTKYFLDKIMQIGTKDFLPDENDILRSRVRTTGIVENNFVIDGNQFKMMDVGGQRNERKKWLHCFSGVTAVLFVVAISEYDQVLFEDEETNRMVEALNLFDEICNYKMFHKTSMILFLNKRDIFAEKIQKVPLTKGCFTGYTGPNTYEAASQFILEQFELRNRDQQKRIYPHLTCATDKDNVKVVFNAVKDTVIRRSLEEGGLIT